MPSLNRRRENDLRGERLESEVRSSEFQSDDFKNRPKFMCSKCGHLYEERSRHCPRCDTRSMGEVKPIPESQLDEARRNAIRRAKEGNGLKINY